MPKNKSTRDSGQGIGTLNELIERAEELAERQGADSFLTVYFYLTKNGQQIKIRFGDTPAADELRVLDVMNGTDAKELIKRSYRYLLRLRRLHGISDSTLP